ncbi:MAG: FAD-dependent oxidoreductase, partial [Sphingomonas sp.]
SAGTMFDEHGVAPEMIAYYVERARGEPGMIAIGATRVVPPEPGTRKPRQFGLYDDDVIPSMRKLVEAVHQHDTKFGIQLWNGGGSENGLGLTLISPSGLPSNVRVVQGDTTGRYRGQANHALETEAIAGIVQHFVDGARRAVACGFDFIEIHAGHGYLISNFLTPLFNRRADRYGGSFENRTRFLLEIVSSINDAVGHQIAIGLKYNGDDFLGEQGWTLEESCRLAPLAQAAGADYITVTAGLVGSPKLTIPPLYEAQGCYAFLAEAVKPTVTIPVGTIGRIKNPLMARDIVAEGKADFVCMGRPTIADSEIFAKTKRGDLADIRPCLADCRGCADEHVVRGRAASCVVNPRMGRELHLIDIEGSARGDPKKILVVGGGLAGIEAARRTAFSGHHVTLCETRERLGGQIMFAKMMPGRSEIGDMMPWYERQLGKYGVDIRLGVTVDAALIRAMAPDIVFVATGSAPSVPQNLLGIVMNAVNVEIMMLDDLIEHKLVAGRNVLVIGGDQNGMVAADYLSEDGRTVTVAEAHNHFGEKLAAHDRWYLLNRQNAKNVRRVKNVHDIEVGDDDEVWLVTDGGRERLPGVDTIVFASERRSERSVGELAEAFGAKTIYVGDAKDVTSSDIAGTIFANIAMAYDAARQI